MYSRSITVTFIGALLVGAWAAGCGDGGTGQSGGGVYGGGYGGTTGTPTGGNGATGGSGSSGGSATGGSNSSGGSSSSGSSGGSTSSSSSGSSSGGTSMEAGKPALTLGQALAQFSACMSYSDFTAQTSNGWAAADVAKSQTTRYGDCNACHNQGDGGFWASYGTVNGTDMTMAMFSETQQSPYLLKWVSGTVDNNGNFKDLVPSNSIVNQQQAASQCMQGTPCHPQFQLDPDVVTAINTFVTTTITKWHSGTCSTTPPATDAGTD